MSWIENTSLFALRCYKLCLRAISTATLKIYAIDDLQYCGKIKCNTMIFAFKTFKQPSSGAYRSSDVGVTVHINLGFNLLAVTSIFECFSEILVTKYSHGLGSSAGYTAPPCVVEILPGRSNWFLPPCRLLHMHAQAMIPTFILLSIDIGLCLKKTLTLSRLRSCEMFDVLRIDRFTKSVGLSGEFSTSAS
jgi:hypothetical protein